MISWWFRQYWYIAVRALEFYCINYGVQIEVYGDLFGLRYDLFGLRYDLNHGLNFEVDPFSNAPLLSPSSSGI